MCLCASVCVCVSQKDQKASGIHYVCAREEDRSSLSNSYSLLGWNVYLVINYTGCLNHTRHRIALSVCAMCVLALRLCLCFQGRAKFQGLIRTKPDLPSRLTSVSLANRAENVLISPATQPHLDTARPDIMQNPQEFQQSRRYLVGLHTCCAKL